MADEQLQIRRYKKRWINLLLLVMFAINNGIHWAQYSVINDVIARYYNVPHSYVEWTTGMSTLSFMIFVIPGLYMLEKIKMRRVMILMSALTTIGAWIKVFTVVPDRFLFAFIAQIMVSASSTVTFSVSARLLAVWFGVHEISRASALSLFGDQFGCSISFIIPSLIVHNNSKITVFESSLKRMHIANASVSTLTLTLIILLFKDQPQNPPSMAQAMKTNMKEETFTQSLTKILKNRAFLMLLFCYGVIGGLLNTMGAVLGEVIAIHFPDSQQDAGKIGFLMMGVGMFMSPIFGFVLDKTRKFREITIVMFTGNFIAFMLFTISLNMKNIICFYIFTTLLGVFFVSTYVNGIQIGIEILYPISEDKCSAVMVFILQSAGFILFTIYGILFRQYGVTLANTFLCILTFLSSVVSCFTPVKLNRQETEFGTNTKELKDFMNGPQKS